MDHPLYALYIWCIKGDIALADPSTPTIVQLIAIESHRKLTAKPGSAIDSRGRHSRPGFETAASHLHSSPTDS